MDLMHDSNAAREEDLTAPPDAATQPTEVESSLDRFLARAAERRAEQEADPKKVAGPWVDPNPDAITALPAKRHPVAVFMRELAQSRAGIAKRKVTLRHVVAELTDRPRTEVTWKDVMTYPWHHVSADMAEDSGRWDQGPSRGLRIRQPAPRKPGGNRGETGGQTRTCLEDSLTNSWGE